MSGSAQVAIVDSGGSNVGSVLFALERLGVTGRLSADPAVIAAASHVILPGVGAAAAGMRKLAANGLAGVIPGLSQPVLGICLGMQLLYEGSEEGDVDCLGVFSGCARRLAPAPGLRIPHMGWNSLEFPRSCPLFEGIDTGSYVYFVHSFALPLSPETVATTDHGSAFAAAATRNNFYAVQFHPERSAAVGARILENFLHL